MRREYRKSLPKLDKKPDEQINGIYIIPDKEYNGFWGKNGYKSYDTIFLEVEIMGRKRMTDEEREISRQKRLQYLRDYAQEHYKDYYNKNKTTILEHRKQKRKEEKCSLCNQIVEYLKKELNMKNVTIIGMNGESQTTLIPALFMGGKDKIFRKEITIKVVYSEDKEE